MAKRIGTANELANWRANWDSYYSEYGTQTGTGTEPGLGQTLSWNKLVELGLGQALSWNRRTGAELGQALFCCFGQTGTGTVTNDMGNNWDRHRIFGHGTTGTGTESLDIKQLQHFVAVADTRSIVRAAERVGITQSGLSRSLQTLETAVGLPLLERRGKGTVLTEFGKELLPRARALLNERERTLCELRAFDRLEQGGLSIGVMPSFNYTVAPGLIADLIKRSPGIELGVSTGTYRELIGRLLDAELHFALLLALAPDRSELVFHPLYESESAVFAAKKHPLANAGRLGVHELLDYPWALTESRPLKLAFERFFSTRTDAVPPLRLTCGSIALLVQSMQATPLLSVLPRQFENSELFRGQLTRIEVDAPASEARAWLVTRPQQVRGPALRLAFDLLAKRFPEAGLPRLDES